MWNSIRISTEARPYPCLGELEDLKRLWLGYYNGQTSLKELIAFVNPAVLHWCRMLTDSSCQKDLNYVLLYNQLESLGEHIAHEAIECWVEEVVRTSDLEHEVRIIFLDSLAGKNKLYPVSSHIKAEFVLSRFFRGRLRNKIVRSWRQRNKNVAIRSKLYPTFYEQNHIDSLFLKNLGIDEFGMYMVYLWLSGSTLRTDIQDFTKISTRKNNKYLEALCQYLLKRI